MQMRETVGKPRNTVFFQWFEAPEGRKVGLLKRRVRSQLARWEMKNCTPLWREAYFEVKMYKAPQRRTAFGSCDVGKVHAVVARSTFPSQNVQSTSASDHLWRFRCRKSARRCGAKHIFKSKCKKHTTFGPLLEVQMSKRCAPLWREAHFQAKMYKTHHSRTTFGSWDVEKVHAVVARSTFPSQNVKNTTCSRHFWRFRCRFALQAQGIVHLVKVRKTWGFCSIFNHNHHYTTLHYTTFHYTSLHYTTLHSTTLQLQLHNYTPLHSIKLHYAKLHSTTLNYNTLHHITLHSTTLHYTTRHYLPLHYTTLHYTTRHYLPLHFTTLHYTTLHNTTTTTTQLHSTTLNFTTLHYTTLHYTTLHWMTLHHR